MYGHWLDDNLGKEGLGHWVIDLDPMVHQVILVVEAQV